jgi:hypothetical protein
MAVYRNSGSVSMESYPVISFNLKVPGLACVRWEFRAKEKTPGSAVAGWVVGWEWKG